ncbi:hypothetical protein lerEdw1_017317 [Lerista edwardsae]|nr:hypothetical protein lerEdw1_017317 [Lerista edwardsae]
MEGTHTVLQLYRPIMELCYVSFYLPKGKVRGFTYKGCVTLDKSNKRLHNCYQVREGLAAAGSKGQRSETIGDIFFKQTTTKDILGELYKLNAEKERLLARLLSSSHILGVKMGNQDGKLQDVSASPKYKGDDQLSFKDQQESFSGSMEKSSNLRNKKPRKFSKRRESIEDFISKRTKRKNLAVLEPSAINSKEAQLGNDQRLSARHPVDASAGSFTRSYNEKVEEKDVSSSDVKKPSERSRRQMHLLESHPALESDTELSVSWSEYDNDVLGHCFAHSSHSLLNDVEDTLKGMQLQQSSPWWNSSQEMASQNLEAIEKTASETVHGYNQRSETGKSKREVQGVSKGQDMQYQLQNIARTSAECDQIPYATSKGSKESMGSVFAMTTQEKVHEGCVSRYNDESCSLPGAVNKTILKVIQHDRLDDAAEWKSLPHMTRGDRGPPALVHEKRPPVPQESNKYLSLNLPINLIPDICQARTSVKQEDRRPQSPSLVAVSHVFNNSHPTSKTHKQVSPLPSPLSSSLPSPQLHHRILPLPSPNTAGGPVLGDSRSSGSSAASLHLVKDLEAQLHLQFSETGLPTRPPSLHQCPGGDPLDQSSPHEKGGIQPPDQWLTGQ